MDTIKEKVTHTQLPFCCNESLVTFRARQKFEFLKGKKLSRPFVWHSSCVSNITCTKQAVSKYSLSECESQSGRDLFRILSFDSDNGFLTP